MLRDILVWTLQNPIQRPRTTVPSLMVISKISRNIEFARVLNMLSARDYNVLLTVPDEKEYLCSVWLYPRLLQYLTKFPICTRSDKSLHGKILSPSLFLTFSRLCIVICLRVLCVCATSQISKHASFGTLRAAQSPMIFVSMR